MPITLLRHAPLPLKNQGRYNGWSNIPIEEKLFEHSKVKSLKKEKFDLIYASDLIRCQQTIKLIFKGQNIIVTKALREVQFKEEIEGKSFEEVAELSSFQPHYLENETKWHNYICQESQLTFTKRLKTFLEHLPNDKNILICSHAGAIREILTLLKKSPKTLNYLESYKL